MAEFPNNFDYVIYGTGLVESILSAALSTTGHTVLHLDKNSYYGGYSSCLRLLEFENLLNEWNTDSTVDYDENIYHGKNDHVKNVSSLWHVNSDLPSENGSSEMQANVFTESSLRSSMRGFEFELFPRLLFSESRIIDALIQSDVTRYLEFKFITKLAAISDKEAIIPIPINRSDIVKTRVFSLRQKRQLTSFLEWCFTVDFNDEIVTKYSGRPLYELMRSEKNLDNFTENIIIESLALSCANVETKEGISKIKRLLQSFNKFGPFPIMWPNYGCGEIPQAFCRMSAVFGAVYSLNTAILSSVYQPSQNGEQEFVPNQSGVVIPINHRKLKLTLSNNSDVYTDRVICHKSYVNPRYIENWDRMKWIARAILVTNKSVIAEIRENNDILMFPFHVNGIEKPAILLEFPGDNLRNERKDELFIVHLTAFSQSIVDSKELLKEFIDSIFDKYSSYPSPLKPQIVFECYFTLAEFSDVSINIKDRDHLVNQLTFVNSSSNDIEMDECLKEARDWFASHLPGVEFLPRPPNPEDIIQLGEETVSSITQISGDFPFATSFVTGNSEVLDAPGDGSTSVAGTTGIVENPELEGQTLSGLIAEIELNATNSELESVNQ